MPINVEAPVIKDSPYDLEALSRVFSAAIGTEIALEADTLAITRTECLPRNESESVKVIEGSTELSVSVQVGDMLPHEDEDVHMAVVSIPDGPHSILVARGPSFGSPVQVEWQQVGTIHETNDGIEVRPTNRDSGDYTTYFMPRGQRGRLSVVSSGSSVSFRSLRIQELHAA